MTAADVRVREATEADVALVLSLVRALADYEKLSDQVVATEALLAEHLFGATRYAEVLIGELDGEPAGYALFFPSYSTFLSQPGIYLEDLFVLPELRGRGVGQALLARVARIAVDRGCGRLEWSVLDWNETALEFYRRAGARAVAGWTVHRLTGEPLRQLAGAGGPAPAE